MRPWSQPLLWKGAATGGGTSGGVCTWNPADVSNVALSASNMQATCTNNIAECGVRAGKWWQGGGKHYFEIWTGTNYINFGGFTNGIATSSAVLNGGAGAPAGTFIVSTAGNIFYNGSTPAGIGNTGAYSTNAVVRVAIDLDNLRGWLAVNAGNWNGIGGYDPGTNTGGVDLTSVFGSNAAYPVSYFNAAGYSDTINLGPTSSFAYAPPSGFSAWCPSGACDPYFGNVVLLMGFEGANGATGAPGMTDESPAANGTATVFNNAKISTALFHAGNSSLLLDGASDVYFPNNSNWNFGTSPFTVECFFYLTSLTLSQAQFLVTRWHTGVPVGSANGFWALWITDGNNGVNNGVLGFRTYSASSYTDLAGTVSPSLNTWHHAAIDFDGTKYRLYLDGVVLQSRTSPISNLVNSDPDLSIGADHQYGGEYLHGNIDEVRITKGVARYASDAGFAVPTAAFPRVQC